jgi:hypothetical protein
VEEGREKREERRENYTRLMRLIREGRGTYQRNQAFLHQGLICKVGESK